MLAYYVAFELAPRLAPLLFTDETPLAPTDPVAPAQRSPAAHAKAGSARTPDGHPAHSLTDLHRRPRHPLPQQAPHRPRRPHLHPPHHPHTDSKPARSNYSTSHPTRSQSHATPEPPKPATRHRDPNLNQKNLRLKAACVPAFASACLEHSRVAFELALA